MKSRNIEKFDDDGAVVIYDNSFLERLIVNENELLLLNHNDDITINRSGVMNLNGNRIKQKLYFDKPYIDLSCTLIGSNFKNYILKRFDGSAVLFEQKLSDKNITSRTEQILTRDEVKKYFDHTNYDAMYLANKRLGLTFAYNKEDGIIIDHNIVPTNEELIELDWKQREMQLRLYHLFDDRNTCTPRILETPLAESIDSLKNVDIYYSLSSDCSDILITSKNGKLKANWIYLSFLGKEQFRLITKEELLFERDTEFVLEGNTTKEKKDKTKLKSIFKK